MRALGVDRQTRDLDLWIPYDPITVAGMARFAQQMGQDPQAHPLDHAGLRLTVGELPHPDVEILNFVAGDPDFDACFNRAQHLALDGEPVVAISAEDLLAIKQACAAIMDQDAVNLADPEKRAASVNTALKERRDIALLERFLAERKRD